MKKPISHALLFLLITAPIYLFPGLFSVAHPLLLLVLLIALTWGFLKWENRKLSVLGLDPTWPRVIQLLAGLGFGMLLIASIAICIRLLLPFKWAWNPNFKWDAALFSLLYYLIGNAVEELIFRGYSFERLITGIGLWKAQAVTAVLFAGFHILNGWPWQIALTGTTIGSLLFGIVFARWRSLPAAIGVHAASNWTRDLLIMDPPTLHTLFAPLSTRPWTPGEKTTAMLIMDALFLLATLAIWLCRPKPLHTEKASSIVQPANMQGL